MAPKDNDTASQAYYDIKLLHSSLKMMDEDLALHVILSGLSNNPTKIIKMFSVASQLMTERSLINDSSLTEYDKKIMENATLVFSTVIKNYSTETKN